MEIFARGGAVVLRPTESTFKVTPKDGIDDVGVCPAPVAHVDGHRRHPFWILVVRALAALGVAPLPALDGVPLVIGLPLGAWELALVAAARKGE